MPPDPLNHHPLPVPNDRLRTLPTKNPSDRGLSRGQRASRQAEQAGSELAKSARKRALDSEEAALLKQLEALRRRRAEEE